MTTNAEIRAAALHVMETARSADRRVAIAESCTGGLVAGALTDIPGSSAVLECGWVTYSNAAKAKLLGVSRRLIVKHGAVSPEVAEAMAVGALARSGADAAVAITGVAGPGGGSPEKPVGHVVFAAAWPGAALAAVARFPTRGRKGVRRASVAFALSLLAQVCAEPADEDVARQARRGSAT